MLIRRDKLNQHLQSIFHKMLKIGRIKYTACIYNAVFSSHRVSLFSSVISSNRIAWILSTLNMYSHSFSFQIMWRNEAIDFSSRVVMSDYRRLFYSTATDIPAINFQYCLAAQRFLIAFVVLQDGGNDSYWNLEIKYPLLQPIDQISQWYLKDINLG